MNGTDGIEEISGVEGRNIINQEAVNFHGKAKL